MGTKERREKEKEQLRSTILEAAAELFLKEGYEHTTIRKIAKEIEYHPSSLYFYFKNKEELFMALQERAFNHFHQTIFTATQHIQDSKEKLAKMGRAYIHFALKNPSSYDLMFILKQPMNAIDDSEKWHKGELSFNMLKDTVKACMEDGFLPEQDVESTAYMIWSAMHGMVSLPICKRMKMFDDADLDFLIRNAYLYFNQFLFSISR